MIAKPRPQLLLQHIPFIVKVVTSIMPPNNGSVPDGNALSYAIEIIEPCCFHVASKGGIYLRCVFNLLDSYLKVNYEDFNWTFFITVNCFLMVPSCWKTVLSTYFSVIVELSLTLHCRVLQLLSTILPKTILGLQCASLISMVNLLPLSCSWDSILNPTSALSY